MKKSALTCFLLPLVCHAQLNVVADLGGDDATPYFAAINKQSGMTVTAPEPSAAPVQQGLDAMLVVSTPEMTPGRVEARALQLPGLGALFLVGDDALSRAWLAENAGALKARHAVGMIVNVSGAEAVQALRELAPGVPLAPASGTELSRRLQLEHYPVLITDSRLSMQVTP